MFCNYTKFINWYVGRGLSYYWLFDDYYTIVFCIDLIMYFMENCGAAG